jgi:hypothetical protein
MKKKPKDEALEKLVDATKKIKRENIPPESQAYKPDTRWRGREPKFAPKGEKPANLINVGGMEVDPSRQKEYEQWHADKLAEQKDRQAQMERNYNARKARRNAAETPPTPPPLAEEPKK